MFFRIKNMTKITLRGNIENNFYLRKQNQLREEEANISSKIQCYQTGILKSSQKLSKSAKQQNHFPVTS